MYYPTLSVTGKVRHASIRQYEEDSIDTFVTYKQVYMQYLAAEVSPSAHLKLVILSFGHCIVLSSICACSSGLLLKLLLHSLQITQSLVLGGSGISSLLLQVLDILLCLHQPLPVLLQTTVPVNIPVHCSQLVLSA